MLYRLFTEHPASVDETYAEHMGMAASFGARMILAGLACLAHAVLPFLFVKTGSLAITALHERMVAKRRRHASRSVDDARRSKARGVCHLSRLLPAKLGDSLPLQSGRGKPLLACQCLLTSRL